MRPCETHWDAYDSARVSMEAIARSQLGFTQTMQAIEFNCCNYMRFQAWDCFSIL